MDDAYFPNGRRAALSLSFDDARLSQIDLGIEMLARHKVLATFYVLAANVERRLYGWKRAVAAGHEIGNHTVTHPCTGNYAFARRNALEDYTLQRMEGELTAANAAIERLLDVRPRTFAYPCGQTFVGRGEGRASYVPLIARRFVVGRGFLGEAPNDPRVCDLACALCSASDRADFPQLKQMVDSAIDAGAWLILCGHEIGQDAHQTTRADALDALCVYCHQRRKDLWLDTVLNVGTHIQQQRAAAASGT